MNRYFGLAVGLILSASAFAIPHENTLVTVDRVELKPNGKLLVSYTLPCRYDDSSQIIMNSDDTGDLAVAVGVIYSAEKRNCGPGPAKQFTREIDPSRFGYTAGPDVTFEPMPVRQR